MTNQEAIIAFSQSEKIKTGLIWISQMIEAAAALQTTDYSGVDKMIRILSQMLSNEIIVARRLASDPEWAEVQRNTDTALVLINSGVMHDAIFNLTKALTGTTGIAQRSMSFLREQKLL